MYSNNLILGTSLLLLNNKSNITSYSSKAEIKLINNSIFFNRSILGFNPIYRYIL